MPSAVRAAWAPASMPRLISADPGALLRFSLPPTDDRSAKDRQFEVGQEVWVYYPKTAIAHPNPKLAVRWKKGTIAEKLGDYTYLIKDIQSKMLVSSVHASRLKSVEEGFSPPKEQKEEAEKLAATRAAGPGVSEPAAYEQMRSPRAEKEPVLPTWVGPTTRSKAKVLNQNNG